MAIRLFRIIVVSLAVAFLGSCNALLGSIFPSTLALVKAQADLSGLIPASNQNPFNVRVVETGGYGYVVVAGSASDGVRSMFFYDLDLNLKLSLTGATAPLGTGVMVDANGQIMAGSTLYSPDLLTSSVPPSHPVINGGFYAGNDGFVVGTSSPENVANISIASNTLTSFQYRPDWSPSAGSSMSALSASMTDLSINAAFDDGKAAGNVIAVISQSGSSNSNDVTAYFVTFSKTGPSSTNPLDSAPHRDNLDRDSFGFADGSIFAYDTSSSSYVRIDPVDASIQSSFSSSTSQSQQLRFAYRVSGGSFYAFDTKTRILTKYAAWW